jgi:hypothetical protein
MVFIITQITIPDKKNRLMGWRAELMNVVLAAYTDIVNKFKAVRILLALISLFASWKTLITSDLRRIFCKRIAEKVTVIPEITANTSTFRVSSIDTFFVDKARGIMKKA